MPCQSLGRTRQTILTEPPLPRTPRTNPQELQEYLTNLGTWYLRQELSQRKGRCAKAKRAYQGENGTKWLSWPYKEGVRVAYIEQNAGYLHVLEINEIRGSGAYCLQKYGDGKLESILQVRIYLRHFHSLKRMHPWSSKRHWGSEGP